MSLALSGVEGNELGFEAGTVDYALADFEKH